MSDWSLYEREICPACGSDDVDYDPSEIDYDHKICIARVKSWCCMGCGIEYCRIACYDIEDTLRRDAEFESECLTLASLPSGSWSEDWL